MLTKTRLLSTEVDGYFTLEAPPTGFNPFNATADELHQYGLPHRPDPKTMPNSARLWRHVMGRIKTFVKPELMIRTELIHQPMQKRKEDASGLLNGGTNWCGTVLTDTPTYIDVYGTWTIPMVQAPPGQTSGSFNVSHWIGLGGYGNNNLLQAGVASVVGVGSAATYYAWVEWFPAYPVSVNNFAVSPGQTLAVIVGAYGDGSGRGLVIMTNLETGVATTPIIVPIPTKDYNGNTITPPFTGPSTASAEWIVERPGTVVNGNIQLLECADFGEINFTGATATIPQKSAKAEVIAAATDSKAISVTMIADNGTTALAKEAPVWALHNTFQQTAAGD